MSVDLDQPGELNVAPAGSLLPAEEGHSPPPEPAVPGEDDAPIRVMALHALLYCERLFFLEEVEEIRLADAAVYDGRRLHEEVVSLDDETPERRSVEVGSAAWGIFGKCDAVRRRDGRWVAYEHKKGRCRRGQDNRPEPWPSDRIQAIAYAVLLEEALGEPVREARIRYHADNVTAFVEIDDAGRDDLRRAIARARELRRSADRPPVTENENLCPRCSLAPICLPEEERLAQRGESRVVPRLFPSDRKKQTLHITSQRARIGRSSETLVVATDEGKQKVPIEDVDSVLVHGHAQVSTQAIHLCASRGVDIAWLTAGGKFKSATAATPGKVQQRIRQYRALSDAAFCLRLARQLVHAKVQTQLRYLLRATRGDTASRERCSEGISRIREALKKISSAPSLGSLLGLEGISAKAYFACLPALLGPQVDKRLHPTGRSKHPPEDRFNAILSFGYALIQSLVCRSIVAVGLEPSLGFYHQPRTAAHPLVLDLMELFRTPVWEMPVIASMNRGQWSPDGDFDVARHHVWLSAGGRKKAIQIFEQRLAESYRHPHTGQSLAYARLVELEARLLEKEWSGCPGIFAQMRLR